MPITERTGISQIVWLCSAAMLQADDVVNLAAKEGVPFGDQTIFAKVVSTSCYQMPQIIVDIATPWQRIDERELWLTS